MDHYETLGVPRDASAADIRKAWKRLMSQTHPDKEGGETADAAEINRAYQALRDPDRRARYDDTGSDEATEEQTAVELMVMQAFAMAMDNPMADDNPVRWAVDQLRTSSAETRGKLIQITTQLSKLKKLRARVKCKGEKNLAHRVIDERVKQLESLQGQGAEKIRRTDLAIKLIGEYSTDAKATLGADAPPRRVAFQWGAFKS